MFLSSIKRNWLNKHKISFSVFIGGSYMIKVGMKAPDFTLESTMGKVSMGDYKDKWIVLFFYPLDFTPI
jgi:hypothetical protein